MNKIILPTHSAMLKADYIFGVATSSFQIEGERRGRCESIWDRFCEHDGAIKDSSNGDIACEHISRWQQDVELITSLGVDAYRLSISWPRVMNDDGTVNDAGLSFYQQLVDALVAKGLKVFVTLYHWDLPQALEDKGGWLNRETAVAFARYTEVVCKALGDKVYAYTTLNEPFCSAHLGYELGIHAPGLRSQAAGRQAAHHLLLAHGLAMQVLSAHCPNSLHGVVLNFANADPVSTAHCDVEAAKIADDYCNHWYIKPILEGQYPDLLAQLPKDVQPDMLAGDLEIIAAPIDYLGVNYYTRNIYQSDGNGWYEQVEPSAETLTTMGWEVVPDSFCALLRELHAEYQLPPLYITENGAAFDDKMENGEVLDVQRLAYFQSHLLAVNQAMEQGVDIRGYFAWSLMDNFEWAEGYTQRFGIVHVDYHTQQRTLKASAKAYQTMLFERKSSV
ncbi:GH1 family beta-glucosidase [Pseudoalteromonas sp. M8]|uniref:GH1 family beta-glucosidase n=1 Tax=Pseudoalteromonas sp. M8 TaxID=2692624 RepID=UPI001BA9FDCB|nr:GH1 family beta-glucosidase [Pseudoalteromonas sp. M8]QUI68618.1 beta-glucosidase [Pseudoalteromonas sp. M8]